MFLYALKYDGVVPSDSKERVTLLHEYGITHLDEHKMTMGERTFGNEKVALLNPTIGKKAAPFKIERASQTWHDCGRYYIGYSNDDPPVNRAFLRPEPLYNIQLTLSGREWQLPVLPVSLPNKFAVDQEGNPYRIVARDFQSYLGLCQRFYDLREAVLQVEEEIQQTQDVEKKQELVNKRRSLEVSDEELFNTAMKIITLNYAISAVEATVMEWLSYEDLWKVVYHCIHAIPPDYVPKKSPLEKL